MKETIIQGIRWSFGGQVVGTALNFLINLILIRLVAPDAFGVLAMIGVFAGFLGVIRSFGTGSSLIFSQKLGKTEINTLFWFNVGSSSVLAGLLIISTPALTLFYREEGLGLITTFFAGQMILEGASTVPLALLSKEMRFDRLFLVKVVTLFLSGIAAIIVAWMGQELLALLLRLLTTAGITFFLSLWLVDWRPAAEFHWPCLKRHYHYGSFLTGSNFLNFLVRNIDDLLIGRYLGDQTLGYYNRAYAILLFPLGNFSRVIARVLFPVFASLQSEVQQISQVYLRVSRTIAVITFPAMAFLLLTADLLVPLLFGETWLPMVPIVRVFAILGAAQSIGVLEGTIFQSLGETRIDFQLGLILKPMMIGMIILGLWRTNSAVGVASYYTVASLISIIAGSYVITKLLGISFWQIVTNLFPAFSITFFATLLTYLSLLWIETSSIFEEITVTLFLFWPLFLILIRIVFPGYWKEQVGTIRTLLKVKPEGKR